MKKVIATALVGFMAMGLLAGCGGGKDKQEENNTLRIGMECGYAPFNWTQQDDSNNAVAIEGGGYANGYDVQIAKKVADGLGKELVIVKTEWDGLVPAVQSGVIDGIIAGMSPTAERKEVIDFTDNYYVSDLVIVVKADGPYANATSIKDFAGAALTAQLNTFHDTVIDQIEGVNHVTAMTDFPSMRVALESGIIDGYVSERPEGISAAAANSAFAYVGFAVEDGFQYEINDAAIAMGIKKDSALTAEVNKVLAGISQEERDSLMADAIAQQPAAE
ncbi:MAG: transporter substrate-binding domain-containing protein [Peptococcaceae bacterium]|nr:transporter substrate-binding domain-containing protein [Peptococcaceae bacterium]MBQ2003527.1 transporter substrate-binding domain-containing protein [Peptococcaceae bacterium]MBQ2021189.1 transporter substrate-binding domain-containing protein [Peptococcaceae bacterium]MBQ2368589.1 transporter substrate-binding domain-containing protein [Peptococcaceae bacterium]MBQ5369653.1 transporter substrate-binding domain-containing protein [Peptococcaceae bacterium]